MFQPVDRRVSQNVYRAAYHCLRVCQFPLRHTEEVVSRCQWCLDLYIKVFPDIYVKARESLWETVRYGQETLS